MKFIWFQAQTENLNNFGASTNKVKIPLSLKYEASSLDQINMIKFWLDYDQKIFSPTNLNVTIFGHIQPLMFDCCCGNIYNILGHVQKLTFVIVNVSVMFSDFGQLDSVK